MLNELYYASIVFGPATNFDFRPCKFSMIFGYLFVKSFSQQFFHEKVFPPHTTSKLDRFFFLVRISIVSIAFVNSSGIWLDLVSFEPFLCFYTFTLSYYVALCVCIFSLLFSCDDVSLSDVKTVLLLSVYRGDLIFILFFEFFLKLDICVPAAVLVDSAVCYWFLALTGIPIYLV